MTIIPCPQCGDPVKRIGPRKFCSDNCRRLFNNERDSRSYAKHIHRIEDLRTQEKEFNPIEIIEEIEKNGVIYADPYRNIPWFGWFKDMFEDGSQEERQEETILPDYEPTREELEVIERLNKIQFRW